MLTISAGRLPPRLQLQRRRLDATRREAFVLTQLVGLAYAEAAEVSGCPVSTIGSRVARAREDLTGRIHPAPAQAQRG
jgi:RNA polymerase sigma-70 factor, ECF subfamily